MENTVSFKFEIGARVEVSTPWFSQFAGMTGTVVALDVNVVEVLGKTIQDPAVQVALDPRDIVISSEVRFRKPRLYWFRERELSPLA